MSPEAFIFDIEQSDDGCAPTVWDVSKKMM